MSQPKIPVDLRDQLARLGLQARCYQPVTHFKRQPPRTLPNVAREDDPWHVVIQRIDRVPWSDGSQVAQAIGETLREAIEKCVANLPKDGLLVVMDRLGRALDGLKVTVSAAR